MVALAGALLEQQRRATIVADQYIQLAVVIEVSDGEASGREITTEGRTRFGRDTDQFASFVIEQEKRLFVLHL